MTSFADVWTRPRASAAEHTQWYYLGRGALAHEDWREAQAALTRATAQLRDSDEQLLLWLSYVGLTALAWRAEEGAAALEHAREASALAERLDDGWARIWSLWLLGHLCAGQQQRAEAGACFSAAIRLLDERDQNQQAMRHLAAVAAMQCAADGPPPERCAEQLFGLLQLSISVGKRQGLPLEALDGLSAPPPLPRAVARGDAGAAGGPINWLRRILPRAGDGGRAPGAAPAAPDHEAAPEPAAEQPDDNCTPDLRAHCLGRFEVCVGETRVTQWAGSKSKTLLKLLLTAYPAMVSAPSLMSSIWSGVPEDLARQRLHTAISDLRRALKAARPDAGGLVVSQNGSYGIDRQANIWVDSVEFGVFQRAGLHYEQAGRHNDARAAFRAAALLYRGDLLAEDAYEDWPIEQRERLKSEYLTLLTRLCMGAFRDGDYVACLSWGHRMVECDSCREDAHRLLMRCYSRLGQRTMALRQHRLCADALRRELDAIPEAETEEIFRRLQQGQEL
jgi:DNA-binding SARP family transcriptional activator